MKYQVIFLVLIFHFSFFIFNFPSAQAEGISLAVSPSLLQIEAIPPSDPQAPLILENQGDKSLNVQVLFKPFSSSNKEDGEIVYFTDNQIPDRYKKIFPKIYITDNGIITRDFELGPKQKKNLELKLSIPKNESSSDYYFSVIFIARHSLGEGGLARRSESGGSPIPQSQTQKDEAVGISPDQMNPPAGGQNFSSINAGIAVNVLLSIGPSEEPHGFIEEFSTPAYLQSGPVPFTVRIKNTGPRFFAPKGIIFIKNMFGQTIGRIDLESRNILAGTIRSLTDTQTASTSSNFSPLNSDLSFQKALWPEGFLLGPYTATLNLSLSDKGPIYNRSIIFLALPIQFIIALIAALLLTIIIFLRVRYRLKTDK